MMDAWELFIVALGLTSVGCLARPVHHSGYSENAGRTASQPFIQTGIVDPSYGLDLVLNRVRNPFHGVDVIEKEIRNPTYSKGAVQNGIRNPPFVLNPIQNVIRNLSLDVNTVQRGIRNPSYGVETVQKGIRNPPYGVSTVQNEIRNPPHGMETVQNGNSNSLFDAIQSADPTVFKLLEIERTFQQMNTTQFLDLLMPQLTVRDSLAHGQAGAGSGRTDRVRRSDIEGQQPYNSSNPFSFRDALYQYAEEITNTLFNPLASKKNLPATLEELEKLSKDQIRAFSLTHLTIKQRTSILFNGIWQGLVYATAPEQRQARIEGFWTWFRWFYVPDVILNIALGLTTGTRWNGLPSLIEAFNTNPGGDLRDGVTAIRNLVTKN